MKLPEPTEVKKIDTKPDTIVGFKFQSKQGWSRDQVKDIVSGYEDQLMENGHRNLKKQIKTQHTKYEVSTKNDVGYRSGRWTSCDCHK